jgi:hypothetical protein
MIEGGFGFHRFWWNLVQYIEDLDVSSLKGKVGPRYGETGCRGAKKAKVADEIKVAYSGAHWAAIREFFLGEGSDLLVVSSFAGRGRNPQWNGGVDPMNVPESSR